MLKFLKKTYYAITSPVNLQALTRLTMVEQLAIVRRQELRSKSYAAACRNSLISACVMAVFMPLAHFEPWLVTLGTAGELICAAWWYMRKTLTTRNLALIQHTVNNNVGSTVEKHPQLYINLLGAFIHYKRTMGIEADWVIKARDYLASLTAEQAAMLTEEQKDLICEIVDVVPHSNRKLSRLVVTAMLIPAAIHALQVLGGDKATKALTNRVTHTNSRRVRAAALRALHAHNPQLARNVFHQAPAVSTRRYARARFTRPVTFIFKLAGLLAGCIVGCLCAFQTRFVAVHVIGMVLGWMGMILAVVVFLSAIPLLGLEAVQDKKQFQQLYTAISQDDPDSLRLLLTNRQTDLGNWSHYFLLSSVLSNITAKCSMRVHPAQIAVLNQLLVYHLTTADFADTHQDLIHTDLTSNLLSALQHIGDTHTAQKLQHLLNEGKLGSNHEPVQRCLDALTLRLTRPAGLLRISFANPKQNLVKASSAPEQNDHLLKATTQDM